MERGLSAQELEEIEAWVTVTVAEAYLLGDEELTFDSFDASPEAQAEREEFARALKAARLQELFDAS